MMKVFLQPNLSKLARRDQPPGFGPLFKYGYGMAFLNQVVGDRKSCNASANDCRRWFHDDFSSRQSWNRALRVRATSRGLTVDCPSVRGK